MNIKQLLTQQKTLLAQMAQMAQLGDENTKILASHDYRSWLAESLGKTQSFLIAHDDYELSALELANYQRGLKKLQNGVPLAYVTGHQPFWLGDFLVNEHTLIPRADTEVLVKVALDFLESQLRAGQNSFYSPQHNFSILDMGTGTGCVAISLAMSLLQKKLTYHITATDVSQAALQVAQQNAILNKVRVDFLQSDWFTALSDEKFNIILSNPPYIDPQDPHLVDLIDEPISALTADNHGLADIFIIIDGAKTHLYPNGLLAIEHGYDQGESVRNYFTQQGFQQVITHKDYGDNDRVTSGVWRMKS